jgi:hypothetical protein
MSTTSEHATEPVRHDSPAKLAVIVLGLTAVISLMLLAFAAPSLNSGAHDLPLAVSGPAAATDPLVAGLDENAPGTFDVTTYDTAAAGADAIRGRDAVGGIAVGADGVTIQTAAGAGSPYANVLKGVGAQLEAAGQQVTYDELAPTTADDPTGSAIAALGFPLIFGGMATSAVLLFLYKGRLVNRLAAVVVLAALAGLATTTILYVGFGAFDQDFWLIAAAVSAGILAIAVPVLGLESRIGTRGLAVMGVLLMFVANPLSGLVSGPQWLPGIWGEVGQLLPIGAAGTAIRSAAYFDGAGATHAWLVLGAWIVAGLLLAFAPRRRGAHAAGVPAAD